MRNTYNHKWKYFFPRTIIKFTQSRGTTQNVNEFKGNCQNDEILVKRMGSDLRKIRFMGGEIYRKKDL